MTEPKILKCPDCTYTTTRSYNLNRHHNAKHSHINAYAPMREEDNQNTPEKDIFKTEKDISKIGKDISKIEKDILKIEKDIPKNEKDIPHENLSVNPNIISKNVTFNETINEQIIEHGKNKLYYCKNCNKGYNQKKYLLNHEKDCKLVDNLTCPKCMISFTNKNNKNRHLKANNCKARSIIHARCPNPQNGHCQNTNCIQLHIYNYGNERLDYVEYEKYLQIFQKNFDIPSIMTKEIHFNAEFPENHNIKYNNDKTALVKVDNEFIIKDLTTLVDELIVEKSRLIQSFARDNKDSICNTMSSEIYDQIIEILLKLVCLREPSHQYKRQSSMIIDMIRNTKTKNT